LHGGWSILFLNQSSDWNWLFPHPVGLDRRVRVRRRSVNYLPIKMADINSIRLFRNAPICHRCTRDRADVSKCTVDENQIGDHATAGYCPIGKFKSGIGDNVAAFLWRFRTQRLTNWWSKRVMGKSCKCEKRQGSLNKYFPPTHPLSEWLAGWTLILK
jgi:hypothetical protein